MANVSQITEILAEMGKLTFADSALSASTSGISRTHTVTSNKDLHAGHDLLPSPPLEESEEPPPWTDIPRVIIEDPALHEDEQERPASPRVCAIGPWESVSQVGPLRRLPYPDETDWQMPEGSHQPSAPSSKPWVQTSRISVRSRRTDAQQTELNAHERTSRVNVRSRRYRTLEEDDCDTHEEQPRLSVRSSATRAVEPVESEKPYSEVHSSVASSARSVVPESQVSAKSRATDAPGVRFEQPHRARGSEIESVSRSMRPESHTGHGDKTRSITRNDWNQNDHSSVIYGQTESHVARDGSQASRTRSAQAASIASRGSCKGSFFEEHASDHTQLGAGSMANDARGSAVSSTRSSRSSRSTAPVLQRYDSDNGRGSHGAGQLVNSTSAGIPTTPPVNDFDEEDLELQLREVQLERALQTVRKGDEADLGLQLREVQIQKGLRRLRKQRASSGQSTVCSACRSPLH